MIAITRSPTGLELYVYKSYSVYFLSAAAWCTALDLQYVPSGKFK